MIKEKDNPMVIKTSKSIISTHIHSYINRIKEDIVKNTCIHVIKDIMIEDFRVCVIEYA